jgi:acetylornithine deacetylase/succinyl-diaminopimelate desuccinylase-like protein
LGQPDPALREFPVKLTMQQVKESPDVDTDSSSCWCEPGDARYLHYICPTAMIFIPCKNGISHNEAESITKEDAVAGARVPAEAIYSIADVA